jgi:DNA-binding transcriptional MerR regulator
VDGTRLPAGRDLDGIDTCAIGDMVAAMAFEGSLTVGEAAARVGLTVHTLRWYERIGLLEQVARDSSGHRQYQVGDIEWLLLLIRLRATGMPVREMIRYAELVRAGERTGRARRELMEEHRERVLEQMAQLRDDLAVIDHKIEAYRASEAAEAAETVARAG